MKCPHCDKEIIQDVVLRAATELAIPKKLAKANEAVALWCDLYKKKYGATYDIDKKTAGIISQKAKQWSLDKFNLLFSCYLAIDEKFYREQKHPLSLFFRDIQKINVAAQTGKNPASSGVDSLMDNFRGLND